jgi:lysophospholipase L1-like esterase
MAKSVLEITKWCYIFCVLAYCFTDISYSQTVKIMPLGDSITQGVIGPATDDAGYRNDLAGWLTSEGIAFDFVGSQADGIGFTDREHEGHAGHRADQIKKDINGYLAANPCDAILLHIGTNDVSSGQTVAGTVYDIGEIIDRIYSYDPNIKIVLSSIIPRTDTDDGVTTILNRHLHDLFLSKRSAGVEIFYAGMNEIFKCNPDWATDYFDFGDHFHPDDVGFSVMALVWLNTLLTAVNSGDDIENSDNFERKQPGITWDNDPELTIRDGDLVNGALTGSEQWQHMAVFKGKANPVDLALTWADDADSAGIAQGGIAMLLDSPARDASGYLAAISADNMLRLYGIAAGTLDAEILPAVLSTAPFPGPGDKFSVNVAGDTDELTFNYYVNAQFAGELSIADHAVPAKFYAGLLLRHLRNNGVAAFRAEGHGDFIAPDVIDDLRVDHVSATSAKLSWTAPGDDRDSGTAALYDLRYTTANINSLQDFLDATRFEFDKTPATAGVQDSCVVLGLLPGTSYTFAIRAADELDNWSAVSNTVQMATVAGELYRDQFERTGIGDDWRLSDAYVIDAGELSNSAVDQDKWNLAVLAVRSNPVEVSLKWGASTDTSGIDQGGIAVMLDSPDTSASGYLITRRILQNQIRLWKITEGQNPIDPLIETPLLATPGPGDEFKIQIDFDEAGNHFTIFLNGLADITITDSSKFIDPDAVAELYCGVMLAGGRNNNVDDFKVVTENNTVAVDAGGRQIALPARYTISRAFPNPFNPQTSVIYVVPVAGPVSVVIYDMMGRFVRTLVDGSVAPGEYKVNWDGRSSDGVYVASGMYIIRMVAGDFQTSRTALFVK